MAKNDLKSQVIEELEDFLEQKQKILDQQQRTMDAAMTAKGTIIGGAFSNAARVSCDRRYDEAKRNYDNLKASLKWYEAMREKYCK